MSYIVNIKFNPTYCKIDSEVEFEVEDYREAFHYMAISDQLKDQGFTIDVKKRLSSYVNAPNENTDLGLGGKTVGDLIEDMKLEQIGDTIKIKGKVKNIKDPWKEYSQSDNIGHFVPIQLPLDCAGQTIKSTGITPNRDITITEDCLLVVKMEHVDNLVFTLTTEDGDIIGTFDLTELVPRGKDAFNSEKIEFGESGNLEDYIEDFKETWGSYRLSPMGILRKHAQKGEIPAGYHIPIALSDFFFEGVPKQYGIDEMTSTTDQDIIAQVTDTEGIIKIIYQQLTILEVNPFQMKMGPLVGKDAVSITSNGEGMDDQIEDVSVLFSRRPTIKWEGTKGTLDGELKYYKFTNGHFSSNPAGHFVPFIIKHHDGETIKVTGSDGSETSLVDPKWTIKVDDFVKDGNKTCKMYANDDLIAEFDFLKLVLNLPRGEDAFVDEKDHGGYGNPSNMYEGLVKTWDNTKCTVTGKLKKLAKAEHPSVKDDPSYYFGFTLCDEFLHQSIDVRGPSQYEVEQKDATDLDYVVQIKKENVDEAIYVYGNDRLTAAFDLSNIQFEE